MNELNSYILYFFNFDLLVDDYNYSISNMTISYTSTQLTKVTQHLPYVPNHRYVSIYPCTKWLIEWRRSRQFAP